MPDLVQQTLWVWTPVKEIDPVKSNLNAGQGSDTKITSDIFKSGSCSPSDNSHNFSCIKKLGGSYEEGGKNGVISARSVLSIKTAIIVADRGITQQSTLFKMYFLACKNVDKILSPRKKASTISATRISILTLEGGVYKLEWRASTYSYIFIDR